ncbi:MAG: phosphoribosylamine--glycine ligase [Elusimicrobiota bacterium]
MNILVLGSGGREHAITWKCAQSDLVKNIYALPGNPGIEELAVCYEGNAVDFVRIKEIIRRETIDLVIVGPESPLVEGVVDYLQGEGIMVFGPDKKAAQFEGSKVFTKNLLKKYDIPSAEFESFTDKDKAMAYVDYLAEKKGYPVVIKADGLASGKGVIIVNSKEEAGKTLSDILQKNVFGAAGKQVVIEEFLKGEEASIQIIVSGGQYTLLPPSQDHKQVFDNDKGPNTGGMGAYSVCPLINSEMRNLIEKTIIKPLMKALAKESIHYKGVLYIGIMVVDGKPFVLEFNVRFGDPETQVVLPLMKNDLVDIAIRVNEGSLDKDPIIWDNDRYAVCVVLASQGYPGIYEKGREIIGLDALDGQDDVMAFHAGTSLIMQDNKTKLVTSGGRVLGIVGVGTSLDKTISKTYSYLDMIHFEGMHFRKDIGKKGLKWITNKA